ncbi:hypothetical protein RQP46_010025 [Phenoliferia psychrophenolica]
MHFKSSIAVALALQGATALRVAGVVDAVLNETLLETALKATYSYVIVGGGTAGLVVAARLSENPNNTVLVLEAGSLQATNPEITIRTLQLPILTQFAADIHELSGESWQSWKGLLPYHKRSETFYTPVETASKGNANFKATYDLSAHGTSGPVQASYNKYVSPQLGTFYDAFRALDVEEVVDMNNGANAGVGWITSSVDPKTQTRSSSEAAYLAPNVRRSNLVVITSALASKVIFSSKPCDGEMVATGVNFLAGNTSTVLAVSASKEIILAGGSINSPQLLELSGVGNPVILKPLGIKPLINLPGVGENLQAYAAYAKKSGILTQAAPILAYLPPSTFMTTKDVETGRSLLATRSADLPKKQQSAVLGKYDVSPMIEVVPLNYNLGVTPEAGALYLGIIPALQHAMSRGSLHINSTNPRAYPVIDPKYFSHPADAFFLGKGAAYVRKLAESPLLAAFIDSEAKPGLDVVPANATDAEWQTWASQNVGTEYHPIGTTAMLPRHDNGVVSSELIVYGTKNLRVIDAGVMPLHIATHIQTTAYAIGEKGAALILGTK